MLGIQFVVFFFTFAGFALSVAIALIILLQRSRDRQSAAFLGVVVTVAGITLMSCMLQVSSQIPSFGVSPKLLLEILCIPLFSLPLALYVFSTEYLTSWTLQRRIITVFFVAQAVGCTILLLSGAWFTEVYFQPEGAVIFIANVKPALLGVNVWLTANTLFGFLVFLNQIIRRKSRADRPVLIGVTIVNAGIAANSINVIAQYSIGTDLLILGTIVLAFPVLQNRLFDPISRLNRDLMHRADQMNLITKVGMHAHSMLDVEALLSAAARDICQSFNYERVQIILTDANEKVPQRGVYQKPKVKTRRLKIRRADEPESLQIPLEIAPQAGDTIRCHIKIQKQGSQAFDANEREVLDILARQLTLAIRNARSFQAAERATQTKSAFITYVGHELRNGVSPILMAAEEMILHPKTYFQAAQSSIVHKDIQLLHENAQRLTDLLTDIMNIGQIESGKFAVKLETFDPLPPIEQAIRSFSGLVLQNVTLKLRSTEPIPQVKADPQRFQQVLANLISNAAKFTIEGTITVELEQQGGFVKIAVADTGVGMSKEELSRLFQPFGQASERIAKQYGGNGLGLYISQQIVHLMGGQISVTSAPRQGTRVAFTLPVAAQDDWSTTDALTAPLAAGPI